MNFDEQDGQTFLNFCRTVRENLRFVFILSSVEDKFPKRCRQFPGMINAMQILPLPHWTKDELVSCVLYHLIGMYLQYFVTISTRNNRYPY